MRKLVKLALAGVAAAAIAGTAAAASAERHVMDVALPSGGTAHIEYYGNLAPKVTIAPGPSAPLAVGWAPMAFPDFTDFGRLFDAINRQSEALANQVQAMARSGAGSAVTPATVASYGSLPAGTDSVSIVSVSNGTGTCTRTTHVTSQGEGKPPKVETSISGSCGSVAGQPSASAPPPRINRS